eukprot:720081-Pyramimonas_sp.AAC.1
MGLDEKALYATNAQRAGGFGHLSSSRPCRVECFAALGQAGDGRQLGDAAARGLRPQGRGRHEGSHLGRARGGQGE